MKKSAYSTYFANAFSILDNKNVVTHLKIYENFVKKTLPSINENTSTYYVNNIHEVLKIVDKNGIQYKKADDISIDEPCTFKLHMPLHINGYIKIFRDVNVCLSHQNQKKVKKIIRYHNNGAIFMDGISINGLFNGKIFNDDNTYIEYKNGISINSDKIIEQVCNEIIKDEPNLIPENNEIIKDESNMPENNYNSNNE